MSKCILHLPLCSMQCSISGHVFRQHTSILLFIDCILFSPVLFWVLLSLSFCVFFYFKFFVRSERTLMANGHPKIVYFAFLFCCISSELYMFCWNRSASHFKHQKLFYNFNINFYLCITAPIVARVLIYTFFLFGLTWFFGAFELYLVRINIFRSFCRHAWVKLPYEVPFGSYCVLCT